jgi:hypothetical protein
LPLLLRDRLLALLVKHFEINLGQMHRRESGARDDIRNIGAQIRIHDIRAADTKQRIELFGRDIARFKNACLLAFDQKRDLAVDFRGHGNGNGRFENTLGQRFGADIDRHFHVRSFLLQKNRRRIRLLERHVLQIHTLDLKHGLLVFVCHDALSIRWVNEDGDCTVR